MKKPWQSMAAWGCMLNDQGTNDKRVDTIYCEVRYIRLCYYYDWPKPLNQLGKKISWDYKF